jgi:lipopolysaccharide export system ATP-binding protein
MDAPTLPPIETPGPHGDAIVEAPTTNGLQVVSIAKSYDKRTVLTDVSVSVGRGEVVGRTAPARRRASIP